MLGVRADDRQLVEETLYAELANARTHATDATELYDEIERAMRAGGKRLRPAFCLMGYRAGGGTDRARAARSAAALELLHAFALMHDDVMDRSPRRRGADATHVALSRMDGVRRDPERFGEAAAILCGDMAMVLADRLWDDAGFGGRARADATTEYHLMREEVVAGQYLDLAAAATGQATLERSRRISVLKSGRYSVERPLLIGAALAEATDEVRAVLRSYGPKVGEAFQLRDDVLGAFGDPEVTGKDAFGDLREGKQTLLVAHARAAASDSQRTTLDRWLGSDALDESGANEVRAVLRDTGAFDLVHAEIDTLLADALRTLDTPPIPEDARVGLTDLARAAAIRDL